MHRQDFETLRLLTGRARLAVGQLQRLAAFGQGESGALLSDLDELVIAIGQLTQQVQDRAARAWRPDHPPRHPAPQHLHPLSTEVDHGVHVARYDMEGRPSCEVATAPALSGQWDKWGHKRDKGGPK
jgi:hypothetical protein